MRILALDPGQSTGVCVLDTSNQEKPVEWMHTLKPRELLWEYLNGVTEWDNPPDVVIIEDYINRPKSSGGFDHTWDKGYTHRVIGSIEIWAYTFHFPVHFQQPYNKVPVAGQLGLNYSDLKNKKSIHMMDAMLHGYKYILDNNLIPKNQVLGSLQGRG